MRGDLAKELAAGGIQVSEDAYNLLKFHGSYEQFDRDTATERKQHGQEKEYQFMLRVRMPGGRADRGAVSGAGPARRRLRPTRTLRITTRQGIQFHGILKGDLKPAIAAINHTLLTTMSACGDVVRNVMAIARRRCAMRVHAPHRSRRADARRTHLLPETRAYYQIFLDEAPSRRRDEEEPLYGATYLPRKFKIGIAGADDNTIDVLTNDLGLIAMFDGDTLRGYNIAVGGGLGMTHNRAAPIRGWRRRSASSGRTSLIAVIEAVIGLQRDHGDRARPQARAAEIRGR